MSTREAFEAHMRQLNVCTRLERQSEAVGGQYRTISVERNWQLWQAAIQHEREECAKVCEVIGEEHWSAYKGRTEPVDKARLYNPHTEGISDGADQCASAIRNREGK